MSLVRLLTAGKSLVDFKDTTSRFRMRTKSLLPKFGSAKNPFAASSKAAAVPAASRAQPQTAPRELTPAEVSAANLKQTKRLPTVVATPPESQRTSQATAAAKVRSRLLAWAQKLNPLAWRANRKPAANPAMPRFGKSPVQGELSLDNVKVVRNDLNDADVEVMPAKIPAAQPAAKLILKANRSPEPAGPAGSRMAACGAGETATR